MKLHIFIFAFLQLVLLVLGERQEDNLLENGDYVFGWEITEDKTDIIFDVTVKTLGFIGFGLASASGMKDADIFLGGVFPNGTIYGADYHSEDKGMPTLDELQNWVLIEGCENGTHTTLKFMRPLVSCDEEMDYNIGEDTLNVIWSFGATDEIAYHVGNRGGKQYNLLDPPNSMDVSKFKIWEVRVNNTMPAVDTSYVCSFHKMDKYDKPHNLVGMEVYLGDELARRHTHHFIVTVCKGIDKEKMEELVAFGVQDCQTQEMLELRSKCNDVMFGWAVGGRRTLLPSHLDMPVGAGTNDDEYVRFEVHYDNPESTPNLQFTAGFNVFFSDEIREQQGGIIIVGKKELDPGLLIPPNHQSFHFSGHCSSEITKEFLPVEGIRAVFSLLHAHVAARKMKIRHFRDNKELPWILVDDNYDFDYQQQRQLREEVLILPGDHLTVECEYSTTDRVSKVTLAGEKTYDEMCHAYVMYYPKMELKGCVSVLPLSTLFPPFGIQAVNTLMIFDPVVLLPLNYTGKKLSTVLDNQNWTPELEQEVQRIQMETPQKGQYYLPGEYDYFGGDVTYPDIAPEDEYQLPVMQCKESPTEVVEPTPCPGQNTDEPTSTTEISSINPSPTTLSSENPSSSTLSSEDPTQTTAASSPKTAEEPTTGKDSANSANFNFFLQLSTVTLFIVKLV